MDSINFSSINTTEEVLKNSKQLQNKIRRELSLQAVEPPVSEFKHPEQLPPVWDNSMLGPYVDSLVTVYLKNKPSLPKQIYKGIKTSKEAPGVKANIKKLTQKSNEINVRGSFLSFQRTSNSFGTEVAENSTSRGRVPPKHITTYKSPINANKINFETNKLVTTSSYRLPLQRFTESTKKKIDFFKEHPHLELDVTSEHTTLFPRRFYRSTETDSLYENSECVNVVEAEVKPPQKAPAVVMQETWNGILKQNKPNSKLPHKSVKLKKTKKVVKDSSLKCLHIAPREQSQEPDKSYDIISSIPSKGIFTLQKQSNRLAKQKKCNFQRFPVLYIRPECQIQKVASISIYGESESILRATTRENPSRNVKYLECKHGDKGAVGEKTCDLEIIPDGVGMDMKEKDDINEAKATKENKFFKALDFMDLYENSTTNSASSTLTHQSSSSNRSFSSLSSSSSLKKVNTSTTVKKLHHSLRSPSKRLLSTSITNDHVKMCKHVQTENKYKETVSTNTSSLHFLTKSPSQSDVPTSANINDTLNKIARLHKAENSIKDDIVAKIFERIREDLPDALELYKNRNSSSAIDLTKIIPISPSEKEYNQEQKNQKHQNQATNSNDESNVKLLPNQVEPLLPCVKEKGKVQINNSQSISQKILIDCYNNSATSISEAQKEVLLQKNPLDIQTIKEINQSIAHDVISGVERIKQEKHEYPTDTEIKRAVKIFINSLTLDECGNEKKTIIDDMSTKRKSIIFPESQLISSNRHNIYTSSDSSIISNSLNRISKIATNFKRTRNTVRWFDVSGSYNSTSLSLTDLESEIDLTNDIQSLSIHTNNSSDGEIKSIGEI